ncbi:MAG: type II toxin-antitoxin system HicA family toxin [Synergistaceae bacterium]|jgi:predicted RNA binding protein YcfA (HicA-like mRNA interferase family)|nr:type II toxin-antitoxin system HicA family toxin [Synergistaceae bacterium]
MRKNYSSRDVIKILESEGWYLVGVSGDHHQFKHSTKKGRTTVCHPKKDLEKHELASISRQTGIKF